jgi:hypothetical protein
MCAVVAAALHVAVVGAHPQHATHARRLGDGLTAGQYGTPSSSDSVLALGICPMIGSVRRSMPVVRSPSAAQVSPRSVLFQRMLVPA